eukprot:CAMPEP_0118876946 /NCGR_PEP_ID=MMETSP1163-20130328/17428_1 /TAXON_ID=124430 /ORGANISM="Phaeomonas parva, Strain CCMP2877" /LENGTH=355 /DNA_ID=CAMNT_0006812607 /DNA_START=48 /DNA_END=1115 /DNA_ORIENTATION=-
MASLLNAVVTASEAMMVPLVEMNVVPDFIVRWGIRRMMADRQAKVDAMSAEEKAEATRAFAEELKTFPIAVATDEANDQHYEVPAALYDLCLGPYKKYSSHYYPKPESTFEESETAMLELYAERSQLEDGMRLLDLGCGWGSVSLFMAEKFPNCQIVGLSNSNSQREYIMGQAAERGLNNVQILTGNINDFEMPNKLQGFDRVISIEMFEHMKNYEKLLGKVSRWLKPGGKLFVHIFTHKEVPYHFEDGWLADNFFTGGTMPSDELLMHFQDSLHMEDHWVMDGTHYYRTANDWLENLDRNRDKLWPVLTSTYGAGNEQKWYVNWRLFFLATAELFGYDNGKHWVVSHYRFVKHA